MGWLVKMYLEKVNHRCHQTQVEIWLEYVGVRTYENEMEKYYE